MEMLVLTVGILKRLYLIYICQQSFQLALLPSLFFMFHINTYFVNFLFTILFYRQFRLCITALQATPAQGKAHAPILRRIIRRSTNASGSHKYIANAHHSPDGCE